MRHKKTPEADLENKRMLFIQIGFVIALGAVLIAFEWTSVEYQPKTLEKVQKMDIEEEIIPITRMKETAPPPPSRTQIIEELYIVEDETELKNELEVASTEADQETKIDISESTKIKEIEVEEEEDVIYSFFLLEDKPEFPGGEIELLRFISANIKYPTMARENDITGKVFVGFVIDKNGHVTNVHLKRGVHPSLDEEALRVVRSLPKWKPGRQRGKPVKVEYVVPISFILK